MLSHRFISIDEVAINVNCSNTISTLFATNRSQLTWSKEKIMSTNSTLLCIVVAALYFIGKHCNGTIFGI